MLNSTLPRKTLGRTGFKVTQLGYGSMGLRGPRTWGVRVVDDPTAEEFLNHVLDVGINFIDTSPDYGISEERIGRYIGHRRDEFVFEGTRVVGIEFDVLHAVAGGPQLVGIGPHRRQEQHDLLLVVPVIRAQPQVLGHEYRRLVRRWQMMQRKQLVAEDQQHLPSAWRPDPDTGAVELKPVGGPTSRGFAIMRARCSVPEESSSLTVYRSH